MCGHAYSPVPHHTHQRSTTLRGARYVCDVVPCRHAISVHTDRMPCFICQSAQAAHIAQFNGRPISACAACLARVAESCPTCGHTPRKGRADTRPPEERNARHDAKILAAVTDDLSWRDIVRASGLRTADAMRARERLLAAGRLELRCAASGYLGARYNVVAPKVAPERPNARSAQATHS